MESIRQIKYNKINCTGCGEFTTADMIAFDFGRVFAETVRETEVDSTWLPLGHLDLRFYYSMRDICQELGYRSRGADSGVLVLKVRDIIRQIEFLMLGKSFKEICGRGKDSVLYNTFFNRIDSDYDSVSEKNEALEMLIQGLKNHNEDTVILRVPVQIIFDTDEAGNEMIRSMKYTINGESRKIRDRVCPVCGTLLDSQAGYRREYIIGMAGLSRVGKTAYLAALIHQLRRLPQDFFIHIKDQYSESLDKFEKNIVSAFERGEMIQKTEVEREDAIPLVFLPLQIGKMECNFIFVDMPGEVFRGEDNAGLDFISNRRPILGKADVLWCCIEPSMISSKYKNKNIPAKDLTVSQQLSGLISVLNVVYDIKIPSAIILTQTDLLESDHHLYLPDTNVWEEYFLEDNSINLTHTKEYMESTRSFIDGRMSSFRLSIESSFEGIAMFGVSSYGFDVSDKKLLSDRKIRPSMIELPFLWTLANLGLLQMTNMTKTKTLLRSEKIKLEKVDDPDALFLHDE